MSLVATVAVAPAPGLLLLRRLRVDRTGLAVDRTQ